jgi:hypothetical protein
MWYVKHDALSASLKLVRMSPSNSSAAEIVTLTPVNTSGDTKLTAAAIHDASVQIVNNARYIYYIFQCLSDQEFFVSARITYTYRTARD